MSKAMLRRVAKLREAADLAAAAKARPMPRLHWVSYDGRLDPAQLADGELIAVDVRLVHVFGGQTPQWRLTERVTRDPGDLGLVRDRAGRVVGRVVSMRGSLVDWELLVPESELQIEPVPALRGNPVSEQEALSEKDEALGAGESPRE